MRDVVFTAAGVLSPIGNSLAEFRQNLFSQVSGVTRFEGPEVYDIPVPYIARLRPFEPPGYLDQEFSGGTMFAKATASLFEQVSPWILNSMHIDAFVSGHRGMNEFEFFDEVFRKRRLDWRRAQALLNETPLTVISHLMKSRKSIEIAPDRKIWLSTACCSANDSLGFAFQKIRAGDWSRAVILSMEFEANPLTVINLFRLGALATGETESIKASRPFARKRFGFIKGEAAVLFMIEERIQAEARGAQILGQIAGYGSSNDAFGFTEGHPDGRGFALAMQSALRDSHLTAADIDLISAHATSTPMGDALEAKAIEQVFGAQANKVPVTALKSQVGHATIACGALETLASLMALEQQMIFPILNLEERDPDIHLNLVSGGNRAAALNHVLVNNAGFGGQNTGLVLKRYACRSS